MPHIKYLLKKTFKALLQIHMFSFKNYYEIECSLFKHSLVVLRIKIGSTILTTESQTQLNWLQTVGKTANAGFAAGS